jgi:polyisoprenoid-binding protein YceI
LEAAVATRTTSIIPTGMWAVDAAHSSVQFAVKHMGIATVRGKFTEFEGTLKSAKRWPTPTYAAP